MLAAAAAYAVFSLLRFHQFETAGFDLGIFDQTVWHYSRFEAPQNTIRGLDTIWGDHFSPILMLLAPLYWIWSDPRMLLLAQAVALAAAAVPIFLYARDRLGRAPAALLALAYLVFWGVQSALDIDFHELAFAPVLLASLLLAVDRRRWRLYAGLVLALLCVKEDQSIVVVFLGLYLLTLRQWRAAALTAAAGVAWYVLVVKLLIPHYAPTGAYAYFNYPAFGDGPAAALLHAVTHPGLVVDTLLHPAVKRHTLLYLFVPFLGLALLSRTALLMVPLLAQRFLSATPTYWVTDFHYTLAIAALLFIGTADGAATLLRIAPRPLAVLRRPALVLMAVVLALNLAVSVHLDRGVVELVKPERYRTPAFVAGARRAVAAVPDGVSVAAQDNVIDRLAHRKLAAEISPSTGSTDYVVADVLGGTGAIANSGFAAVSRYVDAQLATHVPVAYHDGWLVLRARSLGPARQAIEPVASGQRLRAASAAWGGAFATYTSALDACAAAAAGPSCYAPLGAAFRRRQARLVAVLDDLRSGLGADCRQLDAPVAPVVTVIAQSLEAERQAGIASDAIAGRAAADRLTRLSAADATGYLIRFVALCT